MKTSKHWVRFLGGMGSVSLIYVPLRILESQPAVYFGVIFLILAYGAGYLLDRTETARRN